MKLVKSLMALAAVAATAAVLAVPADTTSTWTDSTALTATTRMAAVKNPDLALPPHPQDGTEIDDITWDFARDAAFDNAGDICVTFTATPAKGWSVAFDLYEAPLWGSTNVWAVGDVSKHEEGDKVVFTHNGGTDAPLLCLNSGANPPVAGDRFTETFTAWQWASSGVKTCTTLTVVAREDQDDPFYFGWDATIDLTDAYALFTAGGKTATYLNIQDNGRFHTSEWWSRDKQYIQMSSTTYGAMRAGSPDRSFDICLEGW